MEGILSGLSANLLYDKGVDGQLGTRNVSGSTDTGGMVVADDKVAHHVSSLRVSALPEKCKVPFHLLIERGSATGRVKVDLNQRLERIIKVKLKMSKLEGYVADDLFKIEFTGPSGMPTGMNTYGSDATRPTSLILPTALTTHNDMEIARWKDGSGRLESIEVLLKDLTNANITWTQLFLWMEVTKVGWY